jgi:hypothetical protein
MNTKQLQGISIAVILSISIVAMGVIPQAIADEDEPDLIAILEPIDDASEKGKGKAFFWINEDQSLSYSIVLNHVKLPGDSEKGNAPDDKGKNAWDEVEAIHVHRAPGGVHDPEHLLNIIGPADDDDMKIAGQTVHGLWDSDDDPGAPPMQLHQTKEITEVLGDICDEQTDVNVHLHPAGYLRGQIYQNSDACEELFS